MNKTQIFKTIKKLEGFNKSIEHDSFEKFKKNSDKPFQKYEFLGDKVVSPISLDWYNGLVKNFNSACLISNFIPSKKINSEDYFIFKRLLIFNSNLTNKEKIFF